jgi:superfamily II DNA/RNA helicase
MLRLSHWAVRDILAENGLRAVFFTGEEGQKRRTQNIVDFHDDPEARVLFASDAGGVGLNLQRAANCCINLELPWNPAVLEQRIGRIYRIGQKHPIDVYNLVCSEGIEARIFALVGSKKALFTGLFDGTSNEITFERSGSFLSRLEKIVDPVKVPDLKDDGAEDGSEEEMEKLLAQADEASDARAAEAPEVKAIAAPAAGPAGLPSPTEVRKLFSRLQVRPTEGGGISIEAPPDAASSLAALFEGMARLLQGTAKN